VRQIVTTDDGAQQVVLAPVVYLARAHAGRSPLDAAQIHARKIDLRASPSVINSGTVEGDQHTAITATNVINRAGTIASTASDGRTLVTASHDLVNASGAITGQRVTLIAGNDITTTTLVDTDGTSDFAQESQVRQTLPGRPGTITATGTLDVDAGRDIVLRSAAVKVREDTHLHAARDITLDTVEVTTDQSMGRDPRHH
jgi:filamentous hemagglutinin